MPRYLPRFRRGDLVKIRELPAIPENCGTIKHQAREYPDAWYVLMGDGEEIRMHGTELEKLVPDRSIARRKKSATTKKRR